MEQTNYNVDYFIKKFEAIPENSIGQGSIFNRCAYWHCSNEPTYCGIVAKSFTDLFMKHLFQNPSVINDNGDNRYRQPTPKQRIIAALYDIKSMQQPKWKDITSDIAVLPVNETSDLKPQTIQP
jgi:hypothetical protein